MNKRDLAVIAETRNALATGAAKKRRRDAGVSQGEIAAVCGVAQPTVSGWESNHRRPRADHALAYGRALTAAERGT